MGTYMISDSILPSNLENGLKWNSLKSLVTTNNITHHFDSLITKPNLLISKGSTAAYEGSQDSFEKSNAV